MAARPGAIALPALRQSLKVVKANPGSLSGNHECTTENVCDVLLVINCSRSLGRLRLSGWPP